MSASAVLFSGGLDSAVLLAAELAHYEPVWPIHVRAGLAWEEAERRAIDRLLAAPPFAAHALQLTTLVIDMRDVLPATHWAIAGTPPAYHTPDEDVYLEGRNIVLTSKAAVFCARHGVHRLALGPLSGNPFPDARPEFFDAMSRALSLRLDHTIDIVAPFLRMGKRDVAELGQRLGVPLELTLSCMRPVNDRPCGQCSKCRERDDALKVKG